MDQLTIRNAKLGDEYGCHFVETECFGDAEAASLERVRARISIFPDGFLVGVDGSGSIVTILNSSCIADESIEEEDLKAMVRHDPDAKNLVIFSLATLRQHRKRGYASAIMAHYIVWARQSQKKVILLLCKQSMIKYYSAFGFLDKGLSKSQHGGVQWHEMRLQLSQH